MSSQTSQTRSMVLRGVAALSLTLLAAGATATNAATRVAAGNDILHLAYFADMSSPDPDIFYDVEGNTLTQSLYEGLLQYKPNSTQVEGDLATSWSRSSNGLRYTFYLRPHVRFSDGTAMDSTAVKLSFQRRTAVNQGPAYMLADVARYETPNAHTFVVALKHPVSPFLSFMASTWGPKLISPRILKLHAADHAQAWLSTHADGTGPFMLASFQRGQRYVMVRNPYYWGPKPYFREADIDIIPDVSAQLLRLQKGDLDVILHGLPLSDLPSVSSDHNLAVRTFSSLDTGAVYLNTRRPELAKASVRQAVVDAMDIAGLVKTVYGNTATVANSVYPDGLLKPSLAPASFPYNLTAITKALPHGLTLSLVYSQDASGVVQRMADLVRQKLALAGITVNERQVQLPEVYNYIKNLANAPDLYLATPAPDAANPDTWARIVWHSNGALNFFGYSNTAVDAAMDKGLRETNPAAATADYGRVGQVAGADGAVVSFAYVQDVMPMRADLIHAEHVSAYPWALNLGTLARK